MSFRWWYFVLVAFLVLPASCSDSDMTMAEYVDAIDAIFETGIERYEEVVAGEEGRVLIAGQGEHLGLTAGEASLTDFTPYDLHVALERVASIQDEALEAAANIDPPDQLEELHALYFRELPIAPLAERAAVAADWQELSDSSEMAAYREGLAADNEVCITFQETLDATAARGAFEDAPWIPSELKEIVDYALSCDALPQDPQDVYRP